MISKEVIMRGGEYKCRVFKMHLKLRDQQLKTIMHLYRWLYKNLMLTTNQKPVIDITVWLNCHIKHPLKVEKTGK